MDDGKTIKASQIRLSYPEKLVDRWLEAGFRAWLKRQQPRKSQSRANEVNSKLKSLDPSALKRLVNKIKT